jgi:hypothetical protein
VQALTEIVVAEYERARHGARRLAVGDVGRVAAAAEPAQRDDVAARAGGVPVDRLVGDVEPAPAGSPSSARRAPSQVNVLRASS